MSIIDHIKKIVGIKSDIPQIDFVSEGDFVSCSINEKSNLLRINWIIDDLRNLLLGIEDKAFVAGGFVTWLVGATNSYGDIDIFTTDYATYLTLSKRLAFAPRSQAEDTETKVFLNSLNLNVIYWSESAPIMSVEDIIGQFDMNWCMAGLDLITNEIVYVDSVFDSQLIINSKIPERFFGDYYDESKLGERVDKYFDRKINQPSIDRVELLKQVRKAIER